MIHNNIEYVTIQNINPDRPTMLTESGLLLHYEHPEYKDYIFYLDERSPYTSSDPWWSVHSIHTIRTFGCRIGDKVSLPKYSNLSSTINGRVYDLYYPKSYNIEDISNNLDKLILKL